MSRKPWMVLPVLAITAWAGCASAPNRKYAGLWGGRTQSRAMAMLLDEAGGGQMGTPIGLVPLRWRVHDDGSVVVRYSCGDGHVLFDRFTFNAESNTLEQTSHKTVRLNEDRIVKENSARLVLNRQDGGREEWDKGVAYMREGIQKAKAHEAKLRSGRPQLEEADQLVGNDEDVRNVADRLDSGWSMALQGRKDGLQAVNLSKAGPNGKCRISVYGGAFVVGDEADEDFWPVNGTVVGCSSPIPPTAKLKQAGIDAVAQGRFRSAMKDLGAEVREETFSTPHMFYVTFHRSYVAQVADRSALEVLKTLAAALKEESDGPIKVKMWRQKKLER